jgi:hypothetical protein
MHTITLNKIEHAALTAHVTVLRDRMMVSNPDRACLDAVLVKLATGTTIVLARLEVFCLLRALRAQMHALRADMEALEERRLRGGVNGQIDAAYRVLDADVQVLTDVRRRLWDMI